MNPASPPPGLLGVLSAVSTARFCLRNLITHRSFVSFASVFFCACFAYPLFICFPFPGGSLFLHIYVQLPHHHHPLLFLALTYLYSTYTASGPPLQRLTATATAIVTTGSTPNSVAHIHFAVFLPPVSSLLQPVTAAKSTSQRSKIALHTRCPPRFSIHHQPTPCRRPIQLRLTLVSLSTYSFLGGSGDIHEW